MTAGEVVPGQPSHPHSLRLLMIFLNILSFHAIVSAVAFINSCSGCSLLVVHRNIAGFVY